jgi:hypothetical protein
VYLRRTAALAAIAFLASCARDPDDGDMRGERDAVEAEVCAQKTLRDIEATLDTLDFEYHVHDDRRFLLAVKHYDGSGLVAPSITVEVKLDEGENVISCDVATASS